MLTGGPPPPFPTLAVVPRDLEFVVPDYFWLETPNWLRASRCINRGMKGRRADAGPVLRGGMKRVLVGLVLALPLALWACLQGYQVWVVETDGPSCMAPIPAMQAGFGLCLDTAAAMGCPNVYSGWVRPPNPSCEGVLFWGCTGLFRADYAWGY